MKTLKELITRSLILLSLLASPLPAQTISTGDILVQKKTSDGYVLVPLTPAANKVLGFNGSSVFGLQSSWDTAITGLPSASSLLLTDIVPVVVDPGGTPVTKKATVQTLREGMYGTFDWGKITGIHDSLTVFTGDTVIWQKNSSGYELVKLTPGAGKVIGYDGGSEIATLSIGADIQAYNAYLAAISAGSWTGATSITTLGTITAGTWHGTAIGDSYISSASTWNAKENALTFNAPLSRSTNTISLSTASASESRTATSTSKVLTPSNLNDYLTPQTLSSASNATAMNAQSGVNGTLTLSENTTITFSNVAAGMTGVIEIAHSGSARTVAWAVSGGSAVVISGTITTNVAKANLVTWFAKDATHVRLMIGSEFTP